MDTRISLSPLQTSALDEALDAARQRYIAARPRSRETFEAAARVMPGGNTRTVLFHGPFPFRAERGKGAYLFDVDGHRYVNLLGEYTAGLFGHSHPVILAAIQEAMEKGISFGAHNMYEAELARLIAERFGSMEMLRFTNSGTEANLMAIATARAVTRRSKVMVFTGGYHGGLLYFAGRGAPINAPFPYVFGRYNNIDATRATIRANADDLACVLVEPMIGSGGCIPGHPGFLQVLREETERCGAILIFDEVMTSRLGPSGAQGRLGIRPDLTTLGKYFGGGMSFGAFGGQRRLMEIYDPRRPDFVPHAGTFNNNVLTMAAGAAALREVLTLDALKDLNERGENLREQLNDLFRERQTRFQATGQGSLMTIHATRATVSSPEDLADSDDRLKELLFLDLLEEGFYMARRGFIALSLAVTDGDISGFLGAVNRILEARQELFTAAGRRG